MTPATGSIVERLIGVYDADGTITGELSYWVKARLGRAHCSLCDITHGSVRAKPEWNDCRGELRIPFETYHRNDQPDDVRVATGGTAPVVVADTGGRHVMLLGPSELEACDGSIDAMLEAIKARAAELGLDVGLGADPD